MLTDNYDSKSKIVSQRKTERALRLVQPVLLLLVFIVFVGRGAVASTAPEAQRHYPLSSLSQRSLKVGSHVLKAWIMDTEGKREEGMMFLRPKDVRTNEGMLFVFSSPQSLTFWMKNTLMPLDIAFIDSNWHVINTQSMKPLDQSLVLSAGAVEYALEAKPETFHRLGIRPGLTIKLEGK